MNLNKGFGDNERSDDMAFKTNVIKTSWEVITQERGGYHRKTYLVQAESEEKAKLQVPEDEDVVSVTRLDGKG